MSNKQKSQKRNIGKIFMSFGIVLLVAALSLVIYNLYDENRAEKVTVSALKVIEQTRKEPVKPEKKDDGKSEEQPIYEIAPNMSVPEKEIDGYRYIGTLEIPRLGITLPIQSEWSLPNLRVSPCRYKGSPYLDDMAICAHNYRCHFGNIGDLVEGDRIIFTDMDGNVFNYSVSYTELIDGYDVPRMSEGEWDLTLFTCTLSSVQRVTVRCVRETE